jgi:hypothetical protein
VNALSFIAKHNINAINGGDTTITTIEPWLSHIAPLGLERDGYVQIYTGAQNENVFTNDWLGPFWGFKKVVQTFKMTNSPRRFKPIDIYYHLYSGSKRASFEALTYVFDWVMQQDIFPIFTSEYIPRVPEFYNYSIAQGEDGKWLFCGLDRLNTIRIEHKDAMVNFKKSSGVIGVKHFENHTYLSLIPQEKIVVSQENNSTKHATTPYLIESNGHLKHYTHQDNNTTYIFQAHIPLEIKFYVPSDCHMQISPQPKQSKRKGDELFIRFAKEKDAKVRFQCLVN